MTFNLAMICQIGHTQQPRIPGASRSPHQTRAQRTSGPVSGEPVVTSSMFSVKGHCWRSCLGWSQMNLEGNPFGWSRAWCPDSDIEKLTHHQQTSSKGLSNVRVGQSAKLRHGKYFHDHSHADAHQTILEASGWCCQQGAARWSSHCFHHRT